MQEAFEMEVMVCGKSAGCIFDVVVDVVVCDGAGKPKFICFEPVCSHPHQGPGGMPCPGVETARGDGSVASTRTRQYSPFPDKPTLPMVHGDTGDTVRHVQVISIIASTMEIPDLQQLKGQQPEFSL